MKVLEDISLIPAKSELKTAQLYWRFFTLADLAHLEMLVKANVVEKSQKGKIRKGLLKFYKMGFSKVKIDPRNGDLFKNREKWLTKNSSIPMSWFSIGRARREANTLAFNLLVRTQLRILISDVFDLSEQMLNLAESHTQTVMPDYTYLQAAQPSSFGHYILSFVSPLARDMNRLCAAFDNINRCPGGIGSTNGSSLDLDRVYLSKTLGFSGPVLHSRDSMWQADIPVEILSVLTTICLMISRLSDDFHIWTSQEFGFIHLDEKGFRKSVIMPHKKNPYHFSFIRSIFAEVLGAFNSVAVSGHTATGQIDNRLIPYSEVPRAIQSTIDAVKVLGYALNAIKVSASRMEERIKNSSVEATDILNFFVLNEGLTYENAYKIVQEWSYNQAETKTYDIENKKNSLKKIFHANTGKKLKLTDNKLNRLFDGLSLVTSRKGLGGASPQSVRSAANELREIMKKKLRYVRPKFDQIERAERDLLFERG